MLESKAKRTAKKYKMFPKKGAVLVAVSGGADSVALLHYLNKTCPKVCAAHLNHCLRGKNAIADLEFVRNICRVMGIKLFAAKADVKRTSKRLGISIEEAGRTERYYFFERAAKKAGASRIALAHHADDNIETFLMRSMRGTGLKGLCGIPPLRGKIIRPFIDVYKSEVLDYCKRNKLSYRQDSTNLENKFTRNRIRNLLLPAMELENPKIKKEILSLIDGFSKDYALLSRYVSAVSVKIIKPIKDGIAVGRAALLSVPDGLRGHILRKAIERFKGDLNNITSAHIEAILSLRHGRVCLPDNIFVIAENGYYLVTRRKIDVLKPAVYRHVLKFPGKIKINKLNAIIKAEYSKRPKNFKKVPYSAAYLDVSKIKGKKLFVRNNMPGDRFVPFGMKGLKKLQDYFVDMKVPFEKRSLVPIVCDAEKIVWVAGMRADERVKVESSSKKVIRLEILH